MTEPQRYVARPVAVQAIRCTGRIEDVPADWRLDGEFTVDDTTGDVIVQTLQGPSHAGPGDYIVRGTAGEFYPVAALIFEHKYEPLAVIE